MDAKLNRLLKAYQHSHTNPLNIKIHKICVPLIMYSIIGMLWSFPFVLDAHNYFNWATLTVILLCLFYLCLNIRVFFLIKAQSLIMLFIASRVEHTGFLFESSLIIFTLSWIAQFIGHEIEGKKPSFIQDLKFLLIGPVWVYPFFRPKKD